MVAVQQILLRQRCQFSGFDKFSAFKRTGCREGPARSTGLLVLHRSNTTIRDPVNLKRKIHLLQMPGCHSGCRFAQLLLCMHLCKFGVAVFSELEMLSKLILCHIREVIVSQSEGWFGDLVVVGFDSNCRRKKNSIVEKKKEDDVPYVRRKFFQNWR